MSALLGNIALVIGAAIGIVLAIGSTVLFALTVLALIDALRV